MQHLVTLSFRFFCLINIINIKVYDAAVILRPNARIRYIDTSDIFLTV